LNLSNNNTANNGSWGVHGRILPYLEQGNVYDNVDLSTAWDGQLAIDYLKIETYGCPSDPGSDMVRDPGGGRPHLYPTNYGFNFGQWFVYDPKMQRGGDGMFYPNAFLSFRDCLDGASHTLLAAEVKAWTPYRRNGGPVTTQMPTSTSEAETVVASAVEFKDTGHTEWPDGRVHHTGFTVTLPPNSLVHYSNGVMRHTETDFNSWQEGKSGSAGKPTYAVITSRSHHVGLVHVTLVDGSVQSTTNSIDLELWHALGTRAGMETVETKW
jgi:hypothetical protein